MNKGLKILGIVLLALMLSLPILSVAGFAQGPANGQAPAFVDENGDGVCDNCGQMMRGNGRGRGAAFVDENGDGVCDNYGTFPNRQNAQ